MVAVNGWGRVEAEEEVKFMNSAIAQLCCGRGLGSLLLLLTSLVSVGGTPLAPPAPPHTHLSPQEEGLC